ncbi:hypothetical protein RB195_009480 [Necator americanus]|uniref:Mos1 transposase HTH domain-containing protein n=1 Tax=Necator americanus TaxID=51031 RepID=A0ABR1CTI3_NECAM
MHITFWLPLPCLLHPIMAEHVTHIQHVLVYEFESGHLAAEAHRNLSQVFGTEAPSERSVRVWFQRFKVGNEKLEDKSGDRLQYRSTKWRIWQSSIYCNGPRSLGIVKKLGQWLPHALGDSNRQRRLDICTQLLSRSRKFDWLDTIVTGDEKWALYVNHTQKCAWCAGDEMADPFVKGEIHERKVMLSVWWGVHGIYRFELPPDNMTVTAAVYCAQLQNLADKIRKEHQKLDNVRLQHDNACPHIAKKTSQKILELG